MYPHLSDLVAVKEIPGAGRGVVTSCFIEANNLIHVGEAPSVHVIFREYRKEVCASCFFYDRGRTLSVRDNGVGKVFCSEDCRSQWIRDSGEGGVASWRALEAFIQSKSKSLGTIENEPTSKPLKSQIDTAWNLAEKSQIFNADTVQPDMKGRKNRHRPWPTVDPDVLSFLLSAILFHHQRHQEWESELLALAMDDEPYRDSVELESHCVAYQQLYSLLPPDLLASVTPYVCRTVFNAAGHNAFGIRAGSDDNEEYMGYAMYPSASYFNHSCRPNISKKRIGRRWEFRTIKDMPNVGEECCITYLGGDEEDMNVEQRRDRLERTWGFVCACQRCVEEST